MRNNMQGWNITVREFRAQGGVGAYLDHFDFDARCNIVGFSLTYLARTGEGFAAPVTTNNAGARFTSEANDLVNRAKPGDLYYFDNVRAQCPGDAASRQINTMVFSIR